MSSNRTLEDLYKEFEYIIKNFQFFEKIINSFKRIENSQKVVEYISNDQGIIVGEYFQITTPGFYTISTTGEGRGSYVIKNSDNLSSIYSGKLENNSSSDQLCLTVGDVCYFHASSQSGCELKISLNINLSLIDILTQQLRHSNQTLYQLNNRIDNLILESNDEVTPELVDLKSNYWGERFLTANSRFLKLEEKVELLTQMSFPQFDESTYTGSKSYKPFTFVHDDKGNTYVSTKYVPEGISLYNSEYWIKWEIQPVDQSLNKLFVDKELETD